MTGVAYAASGMSFDVKIMVGLGKFKTNLSKRSFTSYDLWWRRPQQYHTYGLTLAVQLRSRPLRSL